MMNFTDPGIAGTPRHTTTEHLWRAPVHPEGNSLTS